MTTEQVLAEVKILIEEGARYHQQGRHALALQCYQKAISLAVSLNDAGLIAYLLSCAGGEHRDCDNYHHAADLLLAALAIIPDTNELTNLRAKIKKLLAITFVDIFGPQKSEVLQLLEEARQDCVSSGDIGQEANILQHLGGCYIGLNRLRDADSMLTMAFQKAQTANDIQLQGWIYDDMANLEIERNDWGMALEYTRTARGKAQIAQDLEGEGDTWVNEARVLLRMGQADNALLAAQHALEIYLQNQNLRRAVRAHRHVAKVLVRLGQIEDSVLALKEAMKIAVRLDLRREQALVHLDIAQIELDRQNYGLAHENGINTRAIAEAENLDDLTKAADDLLLRCRNNERLHS